MAYREMWEIEVRHDGLNKYRYIKGSDKHVVEQKARAQEVAWAQLWQKKLAAEEKKRQREAAIRSKEEKRELATIKTQEALEAINQHETVLAHTLTVDDAINWSDLLDNEQFTQDKPEAPHPPQEPDLGMSEYQAVISSPEPKRSDEKYQQNFLQKLIFRPERAEKKYQADHTTWLKSKEQAEAMAEQQFAADHDEWKLARQAFEEKNTAYLEQVKDWQEAKLKFEQKRNEKNEAILARKTQYMNLEPGAVSDYCEMVLSNSLYPDCFPQQWDIDYQEQTKVLVVDYSLPDMERLPTVKEVKYVASRDEFTEIHLSRTALNKLYDGLLCQIALRTMHELYEADIANALDSVVFNGWIDAVDKATGQDVNTCIMSIQASRDEFLAINLGRVDPKACFKELKGMGNKLHSLSPVVPIIRIDKTG